MVDINYSDNKKSSIISIQDAYNLVKYSEAIIIDVRSRQEFFEGHIKGSTNIPLIDLNKYSFNKNKIIVLFCNAGIRSRKAKILLENKGYKNVYILESMEIP